ncbi:MAG: hypothetical protein AAF447_10295 [Myxococcota bacterium]
MPAGTRRRLGALLLAFAFAGTPASAQVGIAVEALAEGDVRLDGRLDEWRRVRRVQVGEGADASLRFALGATDRGLLVAGEVQDERLVRRRDLDRRQDAVVLTFAVRAPGTRRWDTRELWLLAGEPGRSAGRVAVGALGAAPRLGEGARLVEAPASGGYTFEAFVPFALLPVAEGGGPSRAAFDQGRLAVRLQDVDREARPEIEAAPATAEVDARALERLPRIRARGGRGALIAGFARAQSLADNEPERELRADVAGDAREERLLLLDRFLLVLGPGYRSGRAYDFMALPIARSRDVLAAEARDLTGDGQAELLLRLRQENDRGRRVLFLVVGFDGESLEALFTAELAKETDAGRIAGNLRVDAAAAARSGRRASAGPPTLVLEAGEAEGIGPESYRERPASDALPLLLPWGPVASRSYRWDGARFARVAEARRADEARPARAAARPVPAAAAAVAARPAHAPEADVPSADEVLIALRRARRVPASVAPRFAREVDVTGDRRRERVFVLGRALVVLGPGFREGRGYLYYELPVAESGDLRSLESVDLTGDGKAELLLRAVQSVEDVERELLLVHRFANDGSFSRLLSAEVARRQGERRIVNDVRPLRRGLEFRPGRARGWDAESWPWAREAAAPGAPLPLLLPWADGPRRMRWEGSRFVL